MLVSTQFPSLRYMQLAMNVARQGGLLGELSVGAVLVDHKTAHIVTAYNRTKHEILAHAEILCLQKMKIIYTQKQYSEKYFINCDMYVTLEPCPMCAHAMSLMRVRRIYYGTPSILNVSCKTVLGYNNTATEVYDEINSTECHNITHSMFHLLRP